MKNIKTSVKDIEYNIREGELSFKNNDYDEPWFGLGETVNFNNKEFQEFIENIEKR